MFSVAFHLCRHTFVILIELAGDGYLSPPIARSMYRYAFIYYYSLNVYMCVRVDDLFASAGTRFPTVGPD